MGEELLTLFCPTCAGEQWAEIPPCLDGHGTGGHDDACPDRACVECGTALLLDAPLFAQAAGRAIDGARPGESRSGRAA